MAPLPRYEGTFSFVSSRLYASIKRAIPTYDKGDPKTWPYVTLSTIEKLRPYQGYPDLPTGVAYQREAMKRYENMYTPQERAIAASVNGPLHQRYPYNYDRFDEPKEKVGMSGAEYRSYMANATPMPSTPRVREREEWEQHIPDSAIDCSTPHPHRQPSEPDSPTPATRPIPPSRCTAKSCTETRREAARLRGTLFDKDSQLLSCQSDLKEYETTEKLRRRALEDAEYEVEKEKQRADAAERECMLRVEGNIRLQQRVRELEGKVKQAQDLDGYCVELEGEIERLSRVREGEGEESDDCDDDRSRKRMRSESL
ncbi:hypothetical protein J4E83_004270 [Alternaria metachromatica]|uniref:uncharacterized protein n=1 Tax=Alternaria metachromatica TaxID=283354 RepID=UPI0020C48483|nr:uncharacterized protein J4E83_004270 [Alternaria metachromatica]KAI4624594.1 hypothetical protein J4E83_004270 [Alternaria metachromatica]